MTVQELIDNVKILDYLIENGLADCTANVLRNYYINTIEEEMES